MQVSSYRGIDDKKWATFSLLLLLTVFFFIEAVVHMLQQMGIPCSDDQKFVVESAVLLVCAVFCFYKKKMRDYCRTTFDFPHALVILLSLGLSTYGLRTITEYSLPLLSDERLCQLGPLVYILFCISWWVVLTLSSILISILAQYRWIAIFLIACFLTGFAAIPLSGWFVIAYFFILSLTTILKRNFLYMYIGGIMLNAIEILFFC
jgi:hypothetical protein